MLEQPPEDPDDWTEEEWRALGEHGLQRRAEDRGAAAGRQRQDDRGGAHLAGLVDEQPPALAGADLLVVPGDPAPAEETA